MSHGHATTMLTLSPSDGRDAARALRSIASNVEDLMADAGDEQTRDNDQALINALTRVSTWLDGKGPKPTAHASAEAAEHLDAYADDLERREFDPCSDVEHPKVIAARVVRASAFLRAAAKRKRGAR